MPYVRYSRSAVKQQNRLIRGFAVGAIAVAVGALLLAGIAQDSDSPAAENQIYRLFLPLVAAISAVLWVILGLLYRRAYRESWFCIYSVLEQSFIQDGRPLFRTPNEQDQSEPGNSVSVGGSILIGILMVALAVWSLFQ